MLEANFRNVSRFNLLSSGGGVVGPTSEQLIVDPWLVGREGKMPLRLWLQMNLRRRNSNVRYEFISQKHQDFLPVVATVPIQGLIKTSSKFDC